MQICDLLISGGSIVDGRGGAAWAGDVAILGDRIVAVGDCGNWHGRRRIDATGLLVCPGFIDAHAHDDRLLFDDPAMQPKVSQGVTTVIVGNCGLSVAPLSREKLPDPLYELANGFAFSSFAAYLEALEAQRPATNAACLVGHTTIRVEAMAAIDRRANPDEMAAMRRLCSDAMAAGAIGLSSGLFYPPAQAADWTEVAELVETVGAARGIYTAHIRDEADGVAAAIDEACRIAAAGKVALVISHHKVMGAANFGRSVETLRQIDAAAAAADQPIGFDVYPYIAGASMLSPVIAAAASRVIIAWSEPHPECAGQDLADIAARMGCSQDEAIAALSPGGGIYFLMDEADVQRILAHPGAMIGSDGIPNAHPHPRLWGTFPRVIGHYARDLGLFAIPDAVHRMTGLPAERFGLAGRGVLAAGNFADIVLIDAATIADTATFEAPTSASTGVALVLVNGEPVWDAGGPTGKRPGRVLRGPGYG